MRSFWWFFAVIYWSVIVDAFWLFSYTRWRHFIWHTCSHTQDGATSYDTLVLIHKMAPLVLIHMMAPLHMTHLTQIKLTVVKTSHLKRVKSCKIRNLVWTIYGFEQSYKMASCFWVTLWSFMCNTLLSHPVVICNVHLRSVWFKWMSLNPRRSRQLWRSKIKKPVTSGNSSTEFSASVSSGRTWSVPVFRVP